MRRMYCSWQVSCEQVRNRAFHLKVSPAAIFIEENYLHRIGRSGRFGARPRSVSRDQLQVDEGIPGFLPQSGTQNYKGSTDREREREKKK